MFQVHPSLSLSYEGLESAFHYVAKVITSMVKACQGSCYVFPTTHLHCPYIDFAGKFNAFDHQPLFEIINQSLPGELAKHACSEAAKAISKASGFSFGGESLTTRAGLQVLFFSHNLIIT